ncbi:MAG: hypothetical protein AABZ53_17360 [Planctomycetota bacterium]
MHRTHVQCLILGTIALAGTVSGQSQPTDPGSSDGPVVVGLPRESWKSVELLSLRSAFEFRWQYQEDTLKQDGQATQKNREVRYRELLDLSTEVAIGHRNLLDFTGMIQVGREDVFSRSNSDPSEVHETDLINLYDLSALAFGTSFLPTTVYARREQSLLERPFAGTINETTTEEGIGTRIQSSVAPTSVQYFHRENRLDGDFGNIDTKVSQDTLAAHSTVTLTPSQKLDAAYTFDKISESQAGGYQDSYNRHDASLVHLYTFGGEARPHELRTTLRKFDQDGKRPQERVRFDELLTLRHSDRLETRYDLSVDRQTTRGEPQQLTRGEASIKYRLFESLTSTGSAGVQHLSAPGGFISDDVFVNGALDYTKEVPLGRLDASVGIGFNAQSNGERGSTIRVVNEAYTFTDAFAIVLPRRNIVPGSVQVSPVAGFPLYQEGVDYRLDVFADHAEIRGIVGGGITNGQTLLVSYDVGPEPGSDIDTTTTSTSVRYTVTEGWFDGLSLYSTYRTVGHTVRATDPNLYVLDDVHDLLLGVQYRIAEYDVKYEFNDHASTFDPYTVHRLQGFYVRPLGINSSITAELTHEIIDFSRQDNRVTFDRASIRWNERVNSAFDFTARLEYRSEDSSRNGRSQGIDEILGFTWHKGQTNVYGSLRNSLLEGPGSRQTSQFLQFGFRRTF